MKKVQWKLFSGAALKNLERLLKTNKRYNMASLPSRLNISAELGSTGVTLKSLKKRSN